MNEQKELMDATTLFDTLYWVVSNVIFIVLWCITTDPFENYSLQIQNTEAGWWCTRFKVVMFNFQALAVMEIFSFQHIENFE